MLKLKTTKLLFNAGSLKPGFKETELYNFTRLPIIVKVGDTTIIKDFYTGRQSVEEHIRLLTLYTQRSSYLETISELSGSTKEQAEVYSEILKLNKKGPPKVFVGITEIIPVEHLMEDDSALVETLHGRLLMATSLQAFIDQKACL